MKADREEGLIEAVRRRLYLYKPEFLEGDPSPTSAPDIEAAIAELGSMKDQLDDWVITLLTNFARRGAHDYDREHSKKTKPTHRLRDSILLREVDWLESNHGLGPERGYAVISEALSRLQRKGHMEPGAIKKAVQRARRRHR
jgi:hypothetical protein